MIESKAYPAAVSCQSEQQSCAQERLAHFNRLADQHKVAVYRQIVRECGNKEDAKDVLIEALLKAYRGLDALEAQAQVEMKLIFKQAQAGSPPQFKAV